MQTKRIKRAINGVLLLDKPLGFSSNQALQKVKWLYQAAKAGHTGSLDPLATGLLPICLGEATKFSHFLLDADKSYRALIRLGSTTTTADAEGEVLTRAEVNVDQAQLEQVLQRFVGDIMQVPPMYSALKHEGKALYEYARAGVDIERKGREVTIHEIVLERFEGELLGVVVSCSKGTYIRTLAEDLGERLGCGAHLTALRRTASGSVSVDDAITIEALAALEPAAREARLLPPDVLLGGWPAVRLAAEEAGRFLSGLRRRVAERDCAAVRVYGPEPRAFLGSAHVKAGELIPGRLLSPPEVQALIGAAAMNESKQASTP